MAVPARASAYTIFRTYTFGSDRTFNQIGLTATGNLVELISPAGVPDHLFANAYGVCYQVAGWMSQPPRTGAGRASISRL